MGLLAVGFAFKVSAVPFHMWTPDVYQGTPTPVAAFMAAATKVAAFAVFLRVFAGALGGLVVSWRPVIAAVAVLTMLVGAALAVVQSDLKRMLAYSSISHAGYLLVGLAAAATVPAGVSASMFYLLVYAFMVMGAFMVVQYVSRLGPPDDDAIRERSSLEDYRGLARRHPWAAGLLAVFMLALTGIPPLSGFWAKYYVFLAGIQAGLTWLVVVAVLSSVISAFFYLRVLVVAYLQDPVDGAETEAATGRAPALGIALGLAGLLTVAIGLAPEALIAAARSAERILG
jgi:NADH-quinone oxidoreductase subunit N